MDSIHPNYLQNVVRVQIKKTLARDGIVQLQDFFTEGKMRKLLALMEMIKAKKEYDPIRHRYGIGTMTKQFQSVIDAAKQFGEQILEKRITKTTIMVAEHRDYSLMHDEDPFEKGYDLLLDLTSLSGIFRTRELRFESAEVFREGIQLLLIQIGPSLLSLIFFLNVLFFNLKGFVMLIVQFFGLLVGFIRSRLLCFELLFC